MLNDIEEFMIKDEKEFKVVSMVFLRFDLDPMPKSELHSMAVDWSETTPLDISIRCEVFQ